MEGDQVTCYKFKGDYWTYRDSGKWPEDLLDLFNDNN